MENRTAAAIFRARVQPFRDGKLPVIIVAAARFIVQQFFVTGSAFSGVLVLHEIQTQKLAASKFPGKCPKMRYTDFTKKRLAH